MIHNPRVWLLSVVCLAGLSSPWARAEEPAEAAAPAATTAPAEAAAPAATAPPAVAPAGSPEPPAVQPPDASTIDLAILFDEHMGVVRLQLRHGETPFVEVWKKFIEGKFVAADKDSNGVLDAEEFKSVKPLLAAPPAQNNRFVNVNGRRQLENDNLQLVADPISDEPAGGQVGPGVTREQFVESLRTTTSGPVQIRGAFQASPGSRALFNRLDANHDGKLSTGECERGFDSLRPLDLTESESFAPFQLTGVGPSRGPIFVVPDRSQPGSTRARLAVKLLEPVNSASSLTWADRIREHFFPEPKGVVPKSLTRAATLYDEATFATLDADGDGSLDREELTHCTRKPVASLELTVDLAQEGAPASTATRLDPAFRFDSAARTRTGLQPAKLTTGVEEIEMTSAGPPDANSPRRASFLVTNLKQFDTDNNDYLEENELRRFNAVGLMALDANSDGKLYFDEIQTYMDAQTEAAAVRVVVIVTDHDHALFEAVDTNHDGQLGRRELRQLTNRLTAWDRNGDGELAFEEVPRLYSIQIQQDEPRIPANPFGFGNGNFVANRSRRMQTEAQSSWFTQMDRNSDGDLSRREFLGTAAQFRQLDTDGDQLIDAVEASRAGPAAAATVTPSAPDDEDDS